MPEFRYRARNLEGVRKTGVMAADSSAQVAAMLRQDGFFLTGVEQHRSGGTAALARAPRPGLKELASFSRQLSVMIHSGLPLTAGLRLAAEQTRSRQLAAALSQVLADVEEGMSFSAALGKRPQFPALFVHLVEAGERGGALDLVLSRLALNYEREYQLESRVRSALLYPCVVCALALAVLLVVLFVILPQFSELFADFDVPVPALTRTILKGADFLTKRWFFFVLAAGSLIFGFWRYIRTEKGRAWWDEFSLKLPVFGQILNWTFTSRLARTLSLLTRSTIPILLALETTGKVVDNSKFKAELARCAKRVEQGGDLAGPLSETQLLPPLLIQMIRVGEETGSLDQMLERAADFFESEVERKTKNLASLLEPSIIVFLGAVVLLLLLTTILPLYELMSGMSR